jgi:hypothetical protein
MPKEPMNQLNTEVVALAENHPLQRHRFAREQKVAMLKEADACSGL